MASGNDVQLPDLQVIQRYSLAVRGASAPRADVIAALQADLAWLSAGRDKPAASASGTSAPGTSAPGMSAPAATAPAKKAAAKRAPAKKSARKA